MDEKTEKREGGRVRRADQMNKPVEKPAEKQKPEAEQTA